MKSKILVTGANGQLGREFHFLSSSFSEFEFHFFDRSCLDISDYSKTREVFSNIQPEFLINCAAYTQVDKAEKEVSNAFGLNADAVSNLASLCAKHSTAMIHFSTDYVYDSTEGQALEETDPTTPKSIYGQSKLAGEKAILESGAKHLIFRVSWLYSSFGNNFVKTMLRLAQDKAELQIVDDQTGAPTYARDLARSVLEILSLNNLDHSAWNQIYNFSNTGQCNWHQFAKEIFNQAKIKIKLSPVSSAAFNSPAPRPSWSVMSKIKLTKYFQIEPRKWQESLQDCLNELLP